MEYEKGRTGTILTTDADAPLRPFLRLTEVAKLLGMGRSTVYRWAEEGRLPTVQLGGPHGRYVPREALVAFLEAKAEDAMANLEDVDG